MIRPPELNLPVTLDEMLIELKIELDYRAQVFPKIWQKWKASTKQDELEHRIEIMRAVRALVETIKEADPGLRAQIVRATQEKMAPVS